MTIQTLRRKTYPRPQKDQNWDEWADNLIKELEDLASSTEVGQIGEFIAKLPPGWLPADGSQIKATNHPHLVKLLGGGPTANLPTLTPQYHASHKVGIKAT